MLLGLPTGLNISLDVITVILLGSYCIHPGFTSLLNWKHPESIWLSSSRGPDIEREKREPTGQKRTFWFSCVCTAIFSARISAWYKCRIDPTGCKARVWLTETHQPCFYWFVYAHSLTYVTFSYHLWNQNHSLSAAWLLTWAQSAREPKYVLFRSGFMTRQNWKQPSVILLQKSDWVQLCFTTYKAFRSWQYIVPAK